MKLIDAFNIFLAYVILTFTDVAILVESITNTDIPVRCRILWITTHSIPLLFQPMLAIVVILAFFRKAHRQAYEKSIWMALFLYIGVYWAVNIFNVLCVDSFSQVPTWLWVSSMFPFFLTIAVLLVCGVFVVYDYGYEFFRDMFWPVNEVLENTESENQV